MTTLRFKMRTSEGAPIPNTWFKVEPGYQDSVVQGQQPRPIEFVTNGNGDAIVELVATKNPYFITKQHSGNDEPTAYKLFVPTSTRMLDATVLYVDLSTALRLKTDASLLALIDAKVAALNAAHQVSMIASVVLPGSEGIADLIDRIDAFEALVAQATQKAVDAAIAAEAATLKAQQAIAAVTAANGNSITAGKLANEATKHADEAFAVGTAAKVLGIQANAAILLLTQRVAALGG
jgi:hypothetical protein